MRYIQHPQTVVGMDALICFFITLLHFSPLYVITLLLSIAVKDQQDEQKEPTANLFPPSDKKWLQDVKTICRSSP